MNAVVEALIMAADHLAVGRLDAAEVISRRILTKGEHPGAVHLLAALASRRGQNDEALFLLRRAVQIFPSGPDLHYQCGLLLAASCRSAEAAAAFQRLLELDPAHTDGYAQLEMALVSVGDLPGAEEAFGRAVRLDPRNPWLHSNLGSVRLGGERGCANRHSEIVLALLPVYPEGLYNLGNMRTQAGDVDGALIAFRHAITLRPDFGDARWNRPLVLLTLGNLADGWREYEWRWRRRETPMPPFEWPQWDGENIAGQTILLFAEQGYGDTLQFVRYAPHVAARGARAILVYQPALQRLLAGMPGVTGVYTQGESVPVFDVHCTLLSLPRAFGKDLQSIPADVPYLHSDPTIAERCHRSSMGETRLCVGLMWAGDPRPADLASNAIDRRRSMTLALLAPLARIKGIAFISLQKGRAAAQARSRPAGLTLFDPMDKVADFRRHCGADRATRPCHRGVHVCGPSGARAEEAGVNSVSLRRMLALAPEARRQPAVPNYAPFPPVGTWSLGTSRGTRVRCFGAVGFGARALRPSSCR